MRTLRVGPASTRPAAMHSRQAPISAAPIRPDPTGGCDGARREARFPDLLPYADIPVSL